METRKILVGASYGMWLRRGVKEAMERKGFKVLDVERTEYNYKLNRDEILLMEYACNHKEVLVMGSDKEIHSFEEWNDTFPPMYHIYLVTVEVEEPPTHEYVIILGLNDKDAHTQLAETNDAIGIVGRFLGDCTITECHGFYHGERETTLKIEWYTTDDVETAEEVITGLAGAFNQECVILKDATGNIKFLYPDYPDYVQVIGA